MTDEQFKEYYFFRMAEIKRMDSDGIPFKEQDCLQSALTTSGKRRMNASCYQSRKYANSLKVNSVISNVTTLPGKQFVFTTFSSSTGSLTLLRKQFLSEGWEFVQVSDLKNMIEADYLTQDSSNGAQWTDDLPNHLNARGQEFFRLKKKRFIYFNSEEIKDSRDQKILLGFYNFPQNIRGEYIKVIVGSSKLKEGINLFGIRGIHFVEYPLSISDVRQVIGRATRDCSHTLLPFDSDHWKVEIYTYIVTNEMLTHLISKDYQEDMLQNAINNIRMELGEIQLEEKEEGVEVPQTGGGRRGAVIENYCASLTLEECQQVDACQVDPSKGTCMMLNIDDTVQKMAPRKVKLQEDFLLLLQVNAIDCSLFKPFNQIKDGEGRELSCHRPLYDVSPEDQDLTGVLHPGSMSSEFVQEGIDCSLFPQDLCSQNKYCYWNSSLAGVYSSCENRKQGRHFGCAKYYNGEDTCNADPMCIWKDAERGLLDFSTKKSCQEKYERRLDRHSHGILLELAQESYSLFEFREVSGLDNQEMKGMVKSYRDLIQLYEGKKHFSPNAQLEILQNLLVTDQKKEYVTYLRELQGHLKRDQKAHLKEWLHPTVDHDLQQFLTFYSNFTKATNTQSLNSKHYFVLEWPSERQAPDVYTLSKTQDKLSYVLRFDIEGYTYYISSLEIKEACLSLNNMELLSTVTKTFQGSGLYLKVIFYLQYGRLVKITVEAVPNNLKLESTSCYTFWTMLMSNDVVVPYQQNQCIALWEKNLLGSPPDLQSITNPEIKAQAKECWSKWQKGVFPEPEIFQNANVSSTLKGYCHDKVSKKMDCVDDSDCWKEIANDKSCSKMRTLRNPYKCERRFPAIWTKKCYVASPGPEKQKGGQHTLHQRKQQKNSSRKKN